MQLFAPCVICFKASLDATGNPGTPIVFSPGRVSDHGYVRLRCSKGHDTIVLFDERKHDVLFRSACYALVSGYDREAVSSFSAALERTFEFFIRVAASHYRISPEVAEKSWKLVAKQSERQLGMFIAYYSLITGTPYSLETSMVEFRNKVIHQGFIPSETETEDYGAYVFNQKLALVRALMAKCKDTVAEEEKSEIEAMKQAAPSGVPQFGFKATLMAVDRQTNTAKDITNFRDYLRGIRENRMNEKV